MVEDGYGTEANLLDGGEWGVQDLEDDCDAGDAFGEGQGIAPGVVRGGGVGGRQDGGL